MECLGNLKFPNGMFYLHNFVMILGGAGRGSARLGMAGQGEARQGKDKYFILLLSSSFARGKLGMARRGLAGQGEAWHGKARQG